MGCQPPSSAGYISQTIRRHSCVKMQLSLLEKGSSDGSTVGDPGVHHSPDSLFDNAPGTPGRLSRRLGAPGSFCVCGPRDCEDSYSDLAQSIPLLARAARRLNVSHRPVICNKRDRPHGIAVEHRSRERPAKHCTCVKIEPVGKKLRQVSLEWRVAMDHIEPVVARVGQEWL